MPDIKAENEVMTIDDVADPKAEHTHVTRSYADSLSIWQAVRQNKTLGLIAMSAAFSAALDGYRKSHSPFPIRAPSPLITLSKST